MEIMFFSLPTSCCVTLNRQRNYVVSQTQRRKSKIVSKFNESDGNTRRSANYHHSIWEPDVIESLSTPYTYELYATRLKELKGNAKSLLTYNNKDRCDVLKLACTMQRLGVAYHFEKEIEEAVGLFYPDVNMTSNLHTTALQFRVLRQHGFSIGPDVFDKFRSSDGRFLDSLSSDMEGLLSLYEASHLGMHGQKNTLEEARVFSIQNLKSLMGKLDSDSAEQVRQSLETPLYWRMQRVEARNFIDVYQKDTAKNLTLLKLAKLDYNLVQSIYQQELGELARWWRDLGFKDKLPFSRDRLMENYLWAMGIIFEPQFSKCRIGITKFVCLLLAIDDMYDIYGSLDELECFTDAVDRWDMKAMEDLPQYMKICYVAMLNYVNEVVVDVLKDQGLDTFPYIKEARSNLCRSHLKEARWFSSGYTPTVDEYLENASISVGGPAAIVHAYVQLACTISKEALDCFKHDSEPIYWASRITRLTDDLGTSEAESKRGDVAKFIECYMVQESVSKEEAEDHIKRLIRYS